MDNANDHDMHSTLLEWCASQHSTKTSRQEVLRAKSCVDFRDLHKNVSLGCVPSGDESYMYLQMNHVEQMGYKPDEWAPDK